MSQEQGVPVDLRAIPYKVLVSMEAQHARRREAQSQFARLGLQVDWRVPVLPFTGSTRNTPPRSSPSSR
jgi:hypothetical protein